MAFSYNYSYSKIKQHCYDDDTTSLWAWDSVAYNTGDTKAHSDTWMKSHRLAYNDQYALAYHAADYLCHDCANARHILKIVLQLVVLHSRHIIHPMVSLVNFLLRPRYGSGVLWWPCLCVFYTIMSVPEHISGTTVRSSQIFSSMLPMAVDGSCGALRYVMYFRFLPRDAMNPQYWPWACVCVCLSVSVCLCLSQVGVLLKRLNVGSHKQHHTIAQDCSFLTPKTSAKFDRCHPLRGRRMQVGWSKSATFDK